MKETKISREEEKIIGGLDREAAENLEKIAVAKRMLKQNIEIEIIMIGTELSRKEIEKLKEEIN